MTLHWVGDSLGECWYLYEDNTLLVALFFGEYVNKSTAFGWFLATRNVTGELSISNIFWKQDDLEQAKQEVMEAFL